MRDAAKLVAVPAGVDWEPDGNDYEPLHLVATQQGCVAVRRRSVSELPKVDGGFGCILADPPWAFNTWSGKRGTPHRTANDHYVTTETVDLKDITVADVAAKDCALFMWVVDSHIADAIELGRAWGFEIKTRAFTWRKLTANGTAKIGMGYWTRKQTEMCLLFTRGKPKRKDKGVREIIDAPRREHSRKPDEQYERIERLVDGPYLELFARQAWPGWTAWGNQVGKFEAEPLPAVAKQPPATNDNKQRELPLCA